MIVCVCRNINDKAVADAVDSGARRPRDVQAFHGCSFSCGMCKATIEEIIAQKTQTKQEEAFLLAAE
ncbi:MAG: (2Fe-2S)-binding protein [Robiginitomaculum sp.]|nr:MAG: (2Fe-2S)-binding protein [Robiginitomaculum sp.]